MTKESIAIDLDDVLAAHVEAFIKFSNTNYGTNLKLDDYNDQWVHLWKVSHEEIERRAAEFHTAETIANFELKNEARSALETLAKHHTLFIVTARRKHLINITHEWIEKHLPGVFKGIHFVPIWEANNQISKADICKAIGANYLIDDIPKHCNLVAAAGMQAILFGDYSWNRNETVVPGVTRCLNWDEVLKYFKLG